MSGDPVTKKGIATLRQNMKGAEMARNGAHYIHITVVGHCFFALEELLFLFEVCSSLTSSTGS